MVRASAPQSGTYLDPCRRVPACSDDATYALGTRRRAYRPCLPSSELARCNAANHSFSASTALLKNSAAITLSSAAVALLEHLCESRRQVSACCRRSRY
jgi:hypothetical protein